MPILVGVLVVIGVGAAAAHFLVEPYNPGFLEHPAATRTHVILGGIYLALAPVQFSQTIRRRWSSYHRRAGRMLAGIGLLVGASALFLGLVIPYSGNPERVVIGAFGGFFLLSLLCGVIRVRQGRIDQHREWMIRALAIGLSVATMRLLFIPALMVTGDPTDAQIASLSVISFAVAFCLHAGAAEWFLHSTRRRRLTQPRPLMELAFDRRRHP